MTQKRWAIEKKPTSAGWVWVIGPHHVCLYADTRGGVANPELSEEAGQQIADLVASAPVFADFPWQLNETLSALHEGHVEHHMNGGGNPPGRGECELCDIWHDGVEMLKLPDDG